MTMTGRMEGFLQGKAVWEQGPEDRGAAKAGLLGRGQSRSRKAGPRLPDYSSHVACGQSSTLPAVDGLART